MIKEKTQQTVETVRERERERVILAKIRFINHAQKTNILRVLKNHKNIKEREIGYVDRIISYV